MSHVKNVHAFGKLTGICTGYGGQYNPGQQNLQVEAMTTLMINAQQALAAVNEAQAFYDKATNQRELGFKNVRRLSSSVWLVLKASGAGPLTVRDAYQIKRKIWGARKAKRKADAAAAEAGVKPGPFIYGNDYGTLVNYFAQLVATVEKEPRYTPNEPRLTLSGLQQKLAELKMLNETVTQAEIQLTQARRERNELFYLQEGNLVSTAIAAKNYIRGVFGFQSSQHNEVSQLDFRKPRL